MITVFKNIKETSTPFFRDILDEFERIRNGASKDLVELIRKETDKSLRNELKKDLPAICFSGKFTRREAKAIEQHSGFICLDFDGFKSNKLRDKKKDELCEDRYTFACFISPSDDGLKLIVRIPPSVENHKQYFSALEEYYNCEEFDKSTKDISRVCYESYDPEIYINEFSALWDELPKEKYEQLNVVDTAPTLKLEETDEISRRLLVWWENKFGLVDGSRNHNLYVLCQAMNEFGISEDMCKVIVRQFEQKDFPWIEIKTTVESAYKQTHLHATKFYEDTERLDAIRRDVKQGKPIDSIIEYVSKGDKNEVKKVIEHIIELNSEDEFWSINSKGAVSPVHHLFKKFLQDNGYYKYYHAGSDKFVFVRVQNNLIDDATEDDIKMFVLDYLDKLDNKSIYNYFADKTRYFKEDFLSLLDRLDPKFVVDSSTESYIYFRNCALKITPTEIHSVDYIDLDGYVWRKQIVDRDYHQSDTDECDFKNFVKLVSGEEGTKKSLESTIGFLLHGYKPAAYCPAVIINDEKISENPEGGTGKGLFFTAISKIKRLVDIDGKDFKFDKTFPYQTVSADTQVLVYDDVVKNFDFERLFSIITQGITLEKKNRDAIKVPFEQSPKIVITTNYAIKGSGNSFERRKWEIEFRQYFNRNHTPQDEFGRQLFVEWDTDEWNRFDNYMIGCLMRYLKSGLLKAEFRNIKARKFIADTCYEFYEWCTDKENHRTNTANAQYQMTDLYNDFTEKYPDYGRYGRYNLPQARFYKWLDSYGIYFTGQQPVGSRNSAGKTIKFIRLDDKQLEF